MGIRKGEDWGSPATGPPDATVTDDGALGAFATKQPTSLLRLDPTVPTDLGLAVGNDPRREPTIELPMDVLAWEDKGAIANMIVLGTPPDRLRRWTRTHRFTVVVDGLAWFDGAATTVVIANGQFLHGRDLVPRGHPGDGRAEIQVWTLPRSQRAAARSRLHSGNHVPHPAIKERIGRRIEARADRVVRCEADGHPGETDHVVLEVVPNAYRLLSERVIHHRTDPPWQIGRRTETGGQIRPQSDPLWPTDARHRCRDRTCGKQPAHAWVSHTSSGLTCRASAGVRRYHRQSMLYAPETFTEEEAATLRPYFTNLDGPVFALTNLPEVVKGALFARYSRSDKSLRRLFLDEFVGDLDLTGDLTVDATVGLKRAEELYERVFLEYGDDSVAQLGGVHLACEQASNLLTKVLEWGRLMAYLEQSTRYIPYDSRLLGRYRYLRPSSICDKPSQFGARYVSDLDALFDFYSSMLPAMMDWARERYPKQANDSDFVYKQTIKAKACDTVRGLLPAATLSNVGIYGTGQAYEALLLRMRAHPLPEAQTYAQLMLDELRKVIPSFLVRVDRPERGGAWAHYLESTRDETKALVQGLFGDVHHPEPSNEVTLVDFDPEGEDKVLAAICYAHTRLPEAQLLERVRLMSADERVALLRSYVGDRANRRHKPGRAFERTNYRFDVLGDYGAFRDLQRHRMLTIEWQPLTPHHGYEVPEPVTEAGLAGRYDEAMERSAELYAALVEAFPEQAAYAVSLGYRIRYVMQMNAREAMHLCELRSSPQGHPTYRRVAQAMHTAIAEQAGHRAIAEAMRFVDHGTYDLERLDAERAAEARRALQR